MKLPGARDGSARGGRLPAGESPRASNENHLPLSMMRCVVCARRAADAVWDTIGPGGFGWIECLGDARRTPQHRALAQFITQFPNASAEAVYVFAVAGDHGAARWSEIPPELRVVIEIFRATFTVLHSELISEDA